VPQGVSPRAWPVPAGYDPGMATVQYESKKNAGHKFWTARYGLYAIRIDANPARCLSMAYHHGGPLSPQGGRPSRDEAAAAVSDALDGLPRQKS
jgi:hypothetical protein